MLNAWVDYDWLRNDYVLVVLSSSAGAPKGGCKISRSGCAHSQISRLVQSSVVLYLECPKMPNTCLQIRVAIRLFLYLKPVKRAYLPKTLQEFSRTRYHYSHKPPQTTTFRDAYQFSPSCGSPCSSYTNSLQYVLF